MNDVRPRPFYAEYAWAFDLLIDRPVQKECAVIAAWLVDRGILPGAKILDAWCGTGRYAIELARRGYVVQGIDQSPDLIGVAEGARRGSTGSVSFAVGDIADLPIARYAGIAESLGMQVFVRPYHEGDDHLHIDLGYVTVTPRNCSER